MKLLYQYLNSYFTTSAISTLGYNNVSLEFEHSFRFNNSINLEVMISNLLLSDRLSLPYSKLDMKNCNTEDLINKVVDMFPSKKDRFDITNTVSDIKIIVDETKFVLAIRNLLDNAIKYSKKGEKIYVLKQNEKSN